MKKNQAILLAFLWLSASCSGNSLVESDAEGDTSLATPPDGMGFVALHLENESGNHFSNSEGFEITLSHLSVILSDVTLTVETPATIIKAHGTEDHGADAEPEEHDALTDCEDASHLQEAHYIDLDSVYAFECVAIDIGAYSGLSLGWTDPSETEDIIDLEDTAQAALQVEGTAVLGEDSYSFIVSGNPDTMTLSADYEITADDANLFIGMNASEWFHGIDFSSLDAAENGVIYLDEENNHHTYDHLLEHMEESLSLE